jgi:hypothetical protein
LVRKAGRRLGDRLSESPQHTRHSVEQELASLDFLEMQVKHIEKQLDGVMRDCAEADLLKTLPYVGRILSMVIALEIGKVERFPSAAHLAMAWTIRCGRSPAAPAASMSRSSIRPRNIASMQRWCWSRWEPDRQPRAIVSSSGRSKTTVYQFSRLPPTWWMRADGTVMPCVKLWPISWNGYSA